jgi:hypothetical protein
MRRYLVYIYNDDGSVKEYKGIPEDDKGRIVRSISKLGYECKFNFRGRESYSGPGKGIAFELSPARQIDDIIGDLDIPVIDWVI